jgi:hypothetical protein
VTAWLAAVERRVDDAGRAAGTAGAPDAGRLAADAERLRTVGRRAVALAERADESARGGSRP